jgi:DNA-binding NarL/FixJ family response regulator
MGSSIIVSLPAISPSVIMIIDYRLPSMSGIDLMKAILAIEPRTKVIVISGDETSRRESLDAGSMVFLKKPASIKVITETINKLMNDQ